MDDPGKALFEAAQSPDCLRARVAALEAEVARLEAESARNAAAREAAEAALKQTQEYLRHFCRMAAHDLQSSLYAISGCTHLLKEEVAGKLGDDTDNYLALIGESTHRLQVLVQDMQAYGSADSDPYVLGEADLARALGESLYALATPIAAAGAEIEQEGLPVLRADRQRMVQLFTHLIGNALKFRHPERPPRIAIRGERRDGEWLMRVRDNGIGIPPQRQDQVFELFRRLHSYQSYPGSGLGLSICRRIVERHGGRLGLESREGEGSVFWFSLPAADERSN